MCSPYPRRRRLPDEPGRNANPQRPRRAPLQFSSRSGNSNFSFPIAAAKVGVAEFWVGGSKRPAILHLLEGTLNAQRHRFCPLILAMVKHSMPWRAGRGEPLTVGEIDELNALLLRLQFK